MFEPTRRGKAAVNVLTWLFRALARSLWWITDNAIAVLSGEFVLNIGRRCGIPNGGTMIFIRSVWVSSFAYFIALWLRTLFHAKWPWEFAPGELFHDLSETLAWLGAIFAFTYAALYTRFASQFSYLAGVYNQIMATRSEIQSVASTAELRDPDNNPNIQAWQAGFVEDAQALHLATKKMFSIAIWFMLGNPDVYDHYIATTIGADEGARKLIRSLKRAIGEKELIRMNASKELLTGNPPKRKSATRCPQRTATSPQTSPSNSSNVGWSLTFASFAVGCAAGTLIASRRPS
ncbi:hypothetical protein H7H51_26095 [Mycolicibacterium farcinogenes]|nr:hypothetical protein [Mycolicibacterium farcinogenes]